MRMKRYERELFNSLNREDTTGEEPLKNIKNSLGSLRYVKGNPLFKSEVTIQIDTFFTIGGAMVAPAALPAGLQTQLPVYLFGLNDAFSGYQKSNFFVPVINPWLIVSLGFWQYNLFVVDLPGIPVPFLLQLQPGDFIMYFWDGGAVNRGMVRIRCNNVAYSTLVNSLMSDIIIVEKMRFFVPAAVIQQFENPLIFVRQSIFGKITTDSIDPRLFILPTDIQNNISDIPINIPIDKTLILGFQQNIFCQSITIVMFVSEFHQFLTLNKNERRRTL